MNQDPRQSIDLQNTISLQDFVTEGYKTSTFTNLSECYMFHPATLERWLQKIEWVTLEDDPCRQCQHLRTFFSEEKCQANVNLGGTCYRETLRDSLLPVVRLMLQGKAPRICELSKKIHVKGPAHWDGIGDSTLLDTIQHELFGAFQTLCAELAQAKTDPADSPYADPPLSPF